MSGLAIFGTVLTEANFITWANDLVEDAVRGGEIAPDEADQYRATITKTRRGAIPMIICTNEAADQTLTPERLIAKEWNGKYTEYRWRVDPTDKLKLDFTHIALFAGGERQETPWPLWFDGKPIYSGFAICTWNERTGQHLHIHCDNCASTIVNWIIAKQLTWKRAADPAAPKVATHEAPARLQ